MAIFEAYLPPNSIANTQIGLIDNVRFIRDGKSFLALFLPFVWLTWHRQWFALILYVLFCLLIIGLEQTDWAILSLGIAFLPGLYLFLEGANLRAKSLQSKGWKLFDLIEAANLKDAELLFFDRHRELAVGQTSNPQRVTLPKLPSQNLKKSSDDRPDFGLFAEL